MFKKVLISVILVVLAASAVFAGGSNTLYGFIQGNQTPINFKMWDVVSPSSVGSGACAWNSAKSLTYGFKDVFSFYPTWANNERAIFVAEKGTDGNAFYAVSGLNLLTAASTQNFPTVTAMNPIPTPTAVVSGSQVNLTWTAATSAGQASDIAGYKVYANGTLLGTTATNSYSHTTGTPGTSYTYTIRIVYAGSVDSQYLSAASAAVTYPNPPANPVLSVSSSTLNFAAQTGGANPANQSVTISNTGTGTFTWTAAKTAAWLTLNPSTGAPGATMTASVNIAGLAANTYNDTITVTAPGATGSPKTIAVTLVVSNTPVPIITSATPNSGAQGATITSIAIVGTNTHFTSASTVSFGADITSGTVTFTDATHISVSNVVIGAATVTGARNVTVTTAAETAQGQVFTVTGGTTQPATTLVIDDIEGTLVLPSGYYAFAPTNQPNPIETRVTTDKHEGAYAMNTTYGALADPQNAWRGWGGSFVATKDVSAYDTLSIWVKGDGSATNKLKVQFKDANGNNYGLQDADAISQLSTGWAEYRVGGFKTKMAIVPGTTAHGTMDWTKITEYQIVFSGTGASTGVMVDYLNVTNSTSTGPHITGITPSVGGEKVTVTLTGTSFQASGGTINFAGGGTTTSIKSSDTGSLITSWADGQIVLSLPSMSRGVKTVNIVRADNTPSDNSVTFEVTGTTTGGGTSYNYPNPFNPLGGEKTNIVFTPGNAANVSVYVYDMTAKQIARIEWAQGAPSAQVIWDGKNIYDEIVGDGVYLYRVVDAGSNKMIGKGKILVINK